MNQIHPKPVVMGVGTAMGAVMLATLCAGCMQPGSLPCEKDEWKEVCALDDTGGGGGNGAPAPSGMGMGGSSPSPMMPSGATTTAKCDKWPTVKEIEEKLIMPSCGGKMGASCHVTVFPPKFTTVDEILPAMMDKAPATYCKNDKLINKAEPGKSVILAKVKTTKATADCPSGGAGGGRMPFTPEPMLSQADIDCLEWWVFQVAKQ